MQLTNYCKLAPCQLRQSMSYSQNKYTFHSLHIDPVPLDKAADATNIPMSQPLLWIKTAKK